MNGYSTWDWNSGSTLNYLYAAPSWMDMAGGTWNYPCFLIYMKDAVQPGHTPVQYAYTENNTTYYRRK